MEAGPTPKSPLLAHELARLEGEAALAASLDVERHADQLPPSSSLRERMLERSARWRLFAASCGVTSGSSGSD